MKNYFILLALALVTLVSCDKDELGETPKKEYDVYVIGDEVDGIAQTKPTYRKNGEKVTLQTDGGEYFKNAIFVSNNNVYVAGKKVVADYNTRAVYWKNGKLIELQDDNSYSTSTISLCVVGSDVYIVGELVQKEATRYKYHTVYWKNGVLVYLKGGFSEVESICVVGDDVYVLDGKGYWKNGIRTELPFSVARENIHASDMKVVGNDVYIAGFEEVNDNGKESKIAKYWKNGSPVTLSDEAEANSIYISDNDVYVAGIDKVNDFETYATYWKNGEKIYLSDQSDGNSATSIFVLDNNVFVTGGYKNNSGYWLNKQYHPIDGLSYIIDIFVVKR